MKGSFVRCVDLFKAHGMLRCIHSLTFFQSDFEEKKITGELGEGEEWGWGCAVERETEHPRLGLCYHGI